jgi:hypothetical protein
MGAIDDECNDDRAREEEALGGIQVQNGIVQDLDTRGLLYHAGDKPDEQKVDD